MIVVSDTSPLNYLVLIDVQHVLPALYESVLIPTIVRDELCSPGTPEKVRKWFESGPSWLVVQEAPAHSVPRDIHAGEAAAIALAKSVNAPLLLIDDETAYRYAIRQGLRVTRTLGVLRDAAVHGLLDLRAAFEKLGQTNFRASPQLYSDILRSIERQDSDTPPP
jgi:predicted nucleic acid-binding protein